jgi:hypothetical protein
VNESIVLYQRKIFNDTNTFNETSYSLRVEGGNTEVRNMMLQVDNLETTLALQMSIGCDKAKTTVYFLRSQNASNQSYWVKNDVVIQIQCGDSRRIAQGQRGIFIIV